MGIRDRAMLHLGFATGLRVSELITLPMTALTVQPVPSIRVCGKGRRERALPLWKQAAGDVRAWLAIRGEQSAPEVFLSACGRALTRVGFTYVLQKYAAAAALHCPSLPNTVPLLCETTEAAQIVEPRVAPLCHKYPTEAVRLRIMTKIELQLLDTVEFKQQGVPAGNRWELVAHSIPVQVPYSDFLAIVVDPLRALVLRGKVHSVLVAVIKNAVDGVAHQQAPDVGSPELSEPWVLQKKILVANCARIRGRGADGGSGQHHSTCEQSSASKKLPSSEVEDCHVYAPDCAVVNSV
jgi:integrase-like protein